jgi:hypothetical protein
MLQTFSAASAASPEAELSAGGFASKPCDGSIPNTDGTRARQRRDLAGDIRHTPRPLIPACIGTIFSRRRSRQRGRQGHFCGRLGADAQTVPSCTMHAGRCDFRYSDSLPTARAHAPLWRAAFSSIHQHLPSCRPYGSVTSYPIYASSRCSIAVMLAIDWSGGGGLVVLTLRHTRP